MIISADPVLIWPGFQTQESEEDVDDEDKEFDENNEETMLGREGESQEHEEDTAD